VFNTQDDLWHGVVGTYGIEERNLAGEDVLRFCECAIHNGTWMHPAIYKLHHMIDFVVMDLVRGCVVSMYR